MHHIGEYAWQAVATTYQAESGEIDPRDTSDLKKHWHKKVLLCNGGKKPTGKPGANTNRIFRCIAIERQILDKTSSGMMGASSLEDENNISLTSSEGSEEGREDDDEVKDFVNRPESRAGDGLVGGVDGANFAAPLPPLLPPFVDEVPPVQNEVSAAVDGGAVQNEVYVAVDGGAFCAIITAVVVLHSESLPRAVHCRPGRLKTRATKTRNAPMLLGRLLSYVSHSKTTLVLSFVMAPRFKYPRGPFTNYYKSYTPFSTFTVEFHMKICT